MRRFADVFEDFNFLATHQELCLKMAIPQSYILNNKKTRLRPQIVIKSKNDQNFKRNKLY